MAKKLAYLASIFAVLTAASGAQAGLIGYWAFDEGLGTRALDGSPNRNNGTLMGNPQWVAGKVGMALKFDGVDDWVEVPHAANLTVAKEVTVAAWINAQRHTGPGGESWQGIVAKGESPRSYSFYTEVSGALHFSTAGFGSLSTTTVPLNQWVHVAAAVEGGRHKYYINGEPAGEGGSGIVLPGLADTASVVIGRTHENLREFQGMIDEVYIFDRALTPNQVRGLFNGIVPSWLKAQEPSPPNGGTGTVAQLLTWMPGDTARSHDVYLGTNPTPGPAEFKGRQTWAVYFQLGLTPGAIYYWRIDEVEADGVTIHTGDVWSFRVAPVTAYEPSPSDGAKNIVTDAQLSWTKGATAVSHEVYFSTSQIDVANRAPEAYKGRLFETTYNPGAMANDTVYYWRVDEVESNGTTKHAGAVWSFRTLPNIPITDPNLVGWWKLDETEGTTVVDWSGYGNHGSLRGNPQHISGYDGDALQFDGIDDYVEVPHAASLTVNREVTVMAWINTQRHTGRASDWQAIVAKSNDPRSYSFYTYTDGTLHFSTTSAGAYVGSNSTGIVPLNEWVHVAAMVIGGEHRYYINGQLAGPGGGGIVLPGAADTASVMIAVSHEGSNEFLGMIDDVRIYNVGLTQAKIKEAMRGDTRLAWNPKPADKAITDIERATPLSWSAGEKAGQHDVYFGTDRTAVANATTVSTGIYRGRQAAASYSPPEGIQWGGGPYYWRVDEYNTDGTISTGRVWSFAVADYLIVDDFEDYTADVGSRIFQAWKDGWGYNEPSPGYGGNGTGSGVGNSDSPWVEQTIVHGGSQSMPLNYDNAGTGGKARYSETFREWASPKDWTKYSLKALTLWFYGALANAAEQLYVALEDNAGHIKVVNHLEPQAARLVGWQEWNIELTQFSAAGVNLAAVKKMYIGLGNRTSPTAGGTGKIFVDDIRVYPARCVPSMPRIAADLSGNCIVDEADLEILADLWLDTGFQITPVDPGTTGLIAHYPFSGNANDVVGGHNGTIIGTPVYTTGKIGQAILLNGVDQMVDVGPVGITGAAARTIAGWAKANALVEALPNWINIFGFTGPAGNDGHFDIEVVEALGVRGYGIHVYGWERRIMPIDFEWHHLAASYDGTTIRWYGDGLLIGSDSSRVLATPDNVHMGKRDDNENYWPGCIDEARIYNRQLSDAQIAWVAGHTSPLSIPADLHQDNVINFKDFAVLADSWLEQLFWP